MSCPRFQLNPGVSLNNERFAYMEHTGAYIGMGIFLVARLESFHHDLCFLGNIIEFERIVILDAGVLGFRRQAGKAPVGAKRLSL